MCGIAAIFSPSPRSLSEIQSMTDIIAHRGPDGEGFERLYDGRMLLGHRRLSIVDLSDAGRQPMSYLDGRYWITYNGEVYNYREIKNELEKLGHIFYSSTDTEVILAAFHEWGVSCLNRFNGMWAFVVVDTHLNRVFIARDRMGVKPLYYTRLHKGGFAFCSEIKQLLTLPDISFNPNHLYISQYLKTGANESTKETAFSGVYRFTASHYSYMSLDELYDSHAVKEIKYWGIDPNTEDRIFSESELLEYSAQYYKILRDSVDLRLRADVKVGSALSGGLDSSSIVYLVNDLLKSEVGSHSLQETFSSVYTSSEAVKSADESFFIDSVAQTLGVKSNKTEPDEMVIMSELFKMIYHFDSPPSNTMMSSWETYKMVREKGVVVTLDGQGADEQLAGYLEYLTPYFSTLKEGILREMMAFRKVPRAGKKIYKTLIANAFGNKKYMEKIFRSQGINLINHGVHLNEALAFDITGNIQTLLHYGDRASMAFSVESRMPFLDYRLVEFLAGVPAVYKIHNGWTKYIAREAFSEYLPKNVVWRKDKVGWAIPEKPWFEGKVGDWALKIIRDSEYIRSESISAPSDKQEFLRDLSQSIRVLNVAVWFDQFKKI